MRDIRKETKIDYIIDPEDPEVNVKTVRKNLLLLDVAKDS